jgi:hypothetical protein
VASEGSIVPKSLAPPERRKTLASAGAGGSVETSVGSSVGASVAAGGSVPAGGIAVACGAQAEVSRTKMVTRLIVKNLFDMAVSPLTL